MRRRQCGVSARALKPSRSKKCSGRTAYATGVDPVALRLLNDTRIDPLGGRPFDARDAVPAQAMPPFRLQDKRTAEPGSMRGDLGDPDLAGDGGRSTRIGDGQSPRHELIDQQRFLHSSRPGRTTWHRHLHRDGGGGRRRAGLAPEKTTVRLGDTRNCRSPRVDRFGHDGQRWHVGHARGEGRRQGD